MKVLVDTSVWSLALRRDGPQNHPAVRRLERLLADAEPCLTGVVLQEVLQGLPAPSAERVQGYLAPFELLEPSRATYLRAADVRRTCRADGVAVGTIDCLIAAIAMDHEVPLLTTDADFQRVAARAPLRLDPVA